MGFKNDFVWGAATAAYQIEGAAYEDGKGLNIWDTFCQEEGKIFGAHNGDVACDHYHKMEEDVELMSSLGMKAYRFSLSWSRIIPNGTGAVNPKGIEFYNRLINKLLECNIEPYITLYHWDLPYELHKKGGWLNPQIVEWFGYYAGVVVENFGDRVHNYMTINEPQIFVGNGYRGGGHAPGYNLDTKELLAMGHNVLMAHGTAVKIIRDKLGNKAKIGLAMATSPTCPATNSEEDIAAAERYYFRSDIRDFMYRDSYWLDPICFGHYNEDMYKICGDIMPEIHPGDMEIISQPIDFIGANIYSGSIVKSDGKGGVKTVEFEPGHPRNAFDWPLLPETLYWGPRFYCNRYHLPYFITENGMDAHDAVSLDGKVHDPNREDYLHRYLIELRKAASEGYDVAGYFTWSFMDNFEWSKGYDERFGIVYVDFTTLERIPKDSAYFYKKVIECNGENL